MKKKKSILLVALSVFLISLSLIYNNTGAILKSVETKKIDGLVADFKVKIIDSDPIGNISKGAAGEKTRKITVKNTGEDNMFVRTMIHPVYTTSSEGITHEIKIGTNCQLDIGTDWTKGADGYYYYTKKLPPNTSVDFIQKISVAANLEDGKLALHPKVEGITATGNTYRKAWWQGKTPSGTILPDLQTVDAALNGLKD